VSSGKGCHIFGRYIPGIEDLSHMGKTISDSDIYRHVGLFNDAISSSAYMMVSSGRKTFSQILASEGKN
jgi:hypothetical protein